MRLVHLTLIGILVVFVASGSAQAPQTLSSLVAELERSNPELQAGRREIDMQVARIAPAGAPPDPTFSVGYMGGLYRPFFPSARTDGGFQQFGATQEIPFPGKLALRTGIAATEADRERWNYEDRRRQVAAELKTTYFEYVFVDRSLAIVERNKDLLEQFRRIAEAQFSVGKGLQQDVLQAQLEISALIERQTMLERERGIIRARVNALLYRAVQTPLPATLTFAVRALNESLEALQARVAEQYPALKRDERGIDRSQQALALARKEALPDFAVNFISQRPATGMPWMYGVDFMVKIPVFWQRKQRPLIAEATAAVESSRRLRESTLSMALAQVTEEHLAATTAQRLRALYEDSVLPQARLTLESSLAAYRVGRVDFLSVLTNFMKVLEYEVSYEEQTARHRQALARLEPLLGLTFVE
ncbi:MAG: TolC family protein [Acidobacteria bacterium]|nr:TolC family protein [Acidobacteriota bacterium]